MGKITKPNGLTIFYEIGAVPVPGQPRFGGSFTDTPKNMPEADRAWFKIQRVGGQLVHVALSKKDILYVSYPANGVNFSVPVKTGEDLADALLMILSFRGGK